jgi:hypothetical protein
MSLETLNLSLFHVINGAQDASQFIIRLAIFFANDLLYILLFILTFLWFYGDQDLKNRESTKRYKDMQIVFGSLHSIKVKFFLEKMLNYEINSQ